MNEENMNPSFDSVLALLIEAAEQSAGQPLDADVWVERYPQFAEEIRNYVANRNQFEAVLGPKVAFDPEVNTLGLENASAQSGSRVRYFGDYELIDEIARGGMGVVYKAKQINLNRIVAIKMILSGQLASEQDVLRFRTEAEAAANLDHPRIVPIYEVGQYAGQHYFSMGFVDGKSLAQKIGDGPMAPREAAEMLVKICEGIAYAHDRGVIHRDLKPANILLDQNEQPKVTDFGLAKRLDSDSNLTGTGQILGTPSYMAPEQASGKIDEVGPLADIYSLGAILYCLLTGRPPFQASNPMDTLLQVIDKEPVPPRKLNPSVPLDLETITMRCLDKEPNRRFPSANALAEELERFLRGEPIQSRPIGPLERMRKWVRRRPQTAALIATAFLAISLVALGVPWMRMREAKLRENVGTLEQSLAARTGEVTVAQKAAKTALTEKQLTLRQKLEKEFEGFKVQVSANLDRIQAIRKEAVPGSSRDVESLFLETSALQKSMAAVAKQLGAVAENQSEAFWTEMRPRVHEEGIAWLASSRINSASSDANQPSVSLKGHAFAIAMRPTVKAGNISKAFAVSANGKWLVRPIAEIPTTHTFNPYALPIGRLELVSLREGGAARVLTPSINDTEANGVTSSSWSSKFTSTNQLKTAYTHIRPGDKQKGDMQKIELVLETRSLPLGKVEASRVIDLTELFPPIPFYNPPRSSAEDFVSPTIEFNHDGSRVTIYQSAFNRAGGGVPPFGGWPAATFNSDTGECLGKSLQGAFPLSLVANENRLLLMQRESTDTSEARISGFQTLDLVTGGFSQLGGKGTTSDTNSPGPFSGDPFPIDGVPRNQSRWIQFSPEGDLIAVVQVDRDVNDVGRGYRSVLRLQIIRTSDLSIETTEIPSSFRLQTDELKASSDERPPSIAMAFREDSKQLCVFSDDGLHVFSTPGLKPISSQTINDPNSVKGSHSQDDLPRDWVRPFFANYLDGTHVVCGFTSQPISDGYHRQPQVDDVLNRNEHWKIFEIETAPFGEAGQIRTDRSMAAILVPSSKDAIVAGKRLARVDLGSIRIEEPSGINGQRGPQMRFPNVRWRIGFNQDRFYQEEGRNHQHFRLQPLTLRTHKIKDITRGFLEQEDRIEPIVSPNSDFDNTGRWFFQGNEIWNVSSGQKKQFSDAAGASIVARSGRWLAIYDTDDPFLNQGRVETSEEKGAEASDGILVWDLENDREHLSVPVYPEARFHHFNFLPFTSYLIMSSSPAQGEGSQRLSILDLDKGTWLSNEPSNRRLGIRFTRQFDPAGRTFLYEYSKQLGEAQQPSNVPPSNEQRFGLARISDGVEIFSGDAQDLVYTVYSPKGSWLAYLASVPSQPDQIKGELSLTSTENGATTRRSLGFAAIGDRDACNVEFSADERNVIVSTDQTRGFMRKAELSKNASAYYQYVVEVWRIADWSRVMTTADTGNALKYFVHPNADTIAIEFDGVSQPGNFSDATPQTKDHKSEALKERRWVEFRQLSTGSLIKKHDPATIVASSDDGMHLIIKDHGGDANTSVVDAANGAVVLDMGATVGPIKVSPDGRLLLGHVSQEKALRLWNVPGKSYVDLEVPLSLNLIFGFLPNSQQLIAVDQDKSEISLWNATDGKSAFRFSLGGDHTLDGPIFGLDADYCNRLLRLSPDSKSLAVWMSNVLRVFDLEDGKIRFSIPRAHHAAIVLALDLSPDARWIATGSVDQSVGISNAESGEHVVTLDGYGAAVTGVKFTDDGRHLLTRDATGTLAMWQLDVTDDSGLKPRLNWKIQGDAKTAESMSFAMIASKKQFAYCRSDGSIALARLADGVAERTLATQFSGRPMSMTAREDGKMLAIGGSDGSVYLWDLETENPPTKFDCGQGAVGALAFGPENDMLLTAGADLRVWNLSDQKLLYQCEKSDSLIHHMDLSLDGRDLLIVRSDGSYSHIDLGGRRDGLRSLGFGW